MRAKESGDDDDAAMKKRGTLSIQEKFKSITAAIPMERCSKSDRQGRAETEK